jgi:Tc5 transposase-like protein/DDE superfamily endonuclease
MMSRADNIHVTCSVSGKVTKSHMNYWAANVLQPSMKQSSLLLLDSWSGQTDQQIYKNAFTGSEQCEILQIPPKATGDIQPADVYFFRQWKFFRTQFFNRVSIDQLPIDLRCRNGILKMHSLIHNQLSSQRFSAMIKYAWFSSGYLSTDPGPFDNVQQVCFCFDEPDCSVGTCKDGAFISCSWCNKLLCFRHFFENDHKH